MSSSNDADDEDDDQGWAFTEAPDRSCVIDRSYGFTDSDSKREYLRSLPDRGDVRDTHEIVDRGTDFAWAEPRPDPLPRPPMELHRSGTCFDVESTEMRAACTDSIGVLLDAGDVVLHEVRHQHAGYHTDLVYADVDPGGVQSRVSMTVGQGPIHDPLQRFRVWWHLVERGPRPRSDAIENGRYSDPSKNRKHLEWLLDHGYVARTATDHVDAVVPPSIAELHAVELKLRDWETALEQAERANRSDCEAFRSPTWRNRYGYADYRWVALDAGGIRPALENRERFEDAGVGLLSVAEGGTVTKHIDAAHDPRGRYTRDRAYAESQVWDRIDAGEYVDAIPDDPEPASGDAQQPSLAAFGQD